MMYDFLEVLYWSIMLLTRYPLVLLVLNKVISLVKVLYFFETILLFSNAFLATIFSRE